MEFNGFVKISSDEYRDLCERVAIAEERLERLWDYIEAEDKERAKDYGQRCYTLSADEVKLLTGYTEKMAAAQYIIEQIEKHEANKKEEEQNGNTI